MLLFFGCSKKKSYQEKKQTLRQQTRLQPALNIDSAEKGTFTSTSNFCSLKERATAVNRASMYAAK